MTLNATNKHMSVPFSVAYLAQSYAITNFVTKIGISGKRFDVMRVQFNCLADAALIVSTAILAGVIIAFVNGRSPLSVSWSQSCQMVAVALTTNFVIMSVACQSNLLYMLRRFLYKFTFATFAACNAFAAFSFVFRHRVIANRAWDKNLHTTIANGFNVRFSRRCEAIATGFAGFTDTSRCVFVNHSSIIPQVAALYNYERLSLMGLSPVKAEA